jgi:phosphocarrier protein
VAERSVIIASKVGLHARPAAIFSQAAAQQPAKVTIRKPDGPALDARSVLMIMTLGAEGGQEVILATEGDSPEEIQSLDALEALLLTDLDAH